MMYAFKVLAVFCEYIYRAPFSLALHHTPDWYFESTVLAHALKTPLSSLSLALNNAELAHPTSKELALALQQARVAQGQLQSLLLEPTERGSSRFSVYEVLLKIRNWYISNGCVICLAVASNRARKCRIKGNRFQFEEMLHILVNNAIQAGGLENVIVISLSTSNHKILVSIHDFGAGMSGLERVLCQMNGYTNKASGWGIGLTCARRIISNMHGHLRIRSWEHIGTQVTCMLPQDHG